jgi:hypothetical protein
MARLDLDGLCSHPLRHEAPQIRIDRPIFRRDRIEAGLRSPRRLGSLAGEERLVERLLQPRYDLRPARPVGKQAVHEDDISGLGYELANAER